MTLDTLFIPICKNIMVEKIIQYRKMSILQFRWRASVLTSRNTFKVYGSTESRPPGKTLILKFSGCKKYRYKAMSPRLSLAVLLRMILYSTKLFIFALQTFSVKSRSLLTRFERYSSSFLLIL